jgi:glycosyltransferase involved in cell wall biosynthesis
MRLSLVIPVFNGSPFIEASVAAALRYLEHAGDGTELIVVDDGSRDATATILESIAASGNGLRLLHSPENRGKGHAVREGMRAARGERVVFTDADLAYPLEEIGKILHALDDGADVAIATRVSPDSRFVMSPAFFSYLYTRHVGSRLFNRFVQHSLGLAVADCQAGLKGFRRAAAEAIFSRQTLEGFTFDVEVLFIALRLGLEVREVAVTFNYFSEPTTVDFLRDSWRALRDVLRLRQNARRGRYAS